MADDGFSGGGGGGASALLNETAAQNATADCWYEQQSFIDVKLYIVGVCGTLISLASVCENALLFYLFWTRPRFRASHQFYMCFLAFFDVFVSLSYICIMSVFVVAEGGQSLALYTLWHAYLRPMFTVSHVAMACSSFLIMAATLERYIASIDRFQGVRVMRDNRPLIAAGAIGLGVLTRGTVYFEIEVVHLAECDGFEAMYAVPSALAMQPFYKSVWKFFFRNIATIFVPFGVLAFCNASIVVSLRRQERRNMRQLFLQVAVGRAHVAAARASVRAATRMLLIVVGCYLVSNALNVVITAWEHIDKDDLVHNHFQFYTIGSDIVSLLTVVACALRLPIYCVCNQQIRHEVAVVLSRLCLCARLCRRRQRRAASDGDGERDHLAASPLSLDPRQPAESLPTFAMTNGKCVCGVDSTRPAERALTVSNVWSWQTTL